MVVMFYTFPIVLKRLANHNEVLRFSMLCLLPSNQTPVSLTTTRIKDQFPTQFSTNNAGPFTRGLRDRTTNMTLPLRINKVIHPV